MNRVYPWVALGWVVLGPIFLFYVGWVGLDLIFFCFAAYGQ